MEQERFYRPAGKGKQKSGKLREPEIVRDDYVSHLRSLVPVRGSDPWTFAAVVMIGIYEQLAGFWHFVDWAVFVAVGLAIVTALQRRNKVRFESEVATWFFISLVVVGFLFAGHREYYRPMAHYEQGPTGHVGLGPFFRGIFVPHKGDFFDH